MDERRQFVRLDTQMSVVYTVLQEDEGRSSVTKNVGGGGICLFVDDILKPGQQIQVAMQLPGREESANFIAEVVWCESYEIIGKDTRRKAVEVGVRFVEIAPRDQEAILQHVILNFHPQPRRAP